MKIEFTITENTVELLSNTDTGDNTLIINGVEIPSSSWVGSGYYVYDGISIKKISSLSGNVFCNKVSDTEYELAAKGEASYVTSVNGQTGIVNLDADDIPYNLTQSVGDAIDSNITAISDRALKTNIAKVEPGNTALYRHEVGTYFVNKDGNMCRATSLIQVGNTITVNSNCVVVDVGGEISQINNDLSAGIDSAQYFIRVNNSYVDATSLGRCFIMKPIGKIAIAELNLYVTNMPSGASDFTTIGIFPAGLYPKWNQHVIVSCQDGRYGNLLAQIAADGTLKIFNGNTSAIMGWYRTVIPYMLN